MNNMRQIKFRGFNLKNNCWLYGNYFENRGQHFITKGDEIVSPFTNPEDFEIEIESLGQITWINDKNWVDIYEGDLAIMEDFFGNEVVVQISWYKSGAWGIWGYEILMHELDELEIIGNDYENHELLIS